MIFACINVRFKDGFPVANFSEASTYHIMDSQVIPPRHLPKAGDVVLIRTVGMPQVKLVVDRMKDPDNRSNTLGGPICGKANFYEPISVTTTPWNKDEGGS